MIKKLLLFISFVFCATFLSAQCNELFFSEYVEGYANNKSVEIYNPTDAAVNLSGYSLVRFSNGSTTANEQKIVQLPDVMLAAKDVYIVTVDLTDMSLWDSQFDKPVWNGTNVIDTVLDAVTEMPVLDDDGNVVLGPQYEDGIAIFDPNNYDEQYDLQGKTDVFLCPDYDTNNMMYFNGNDAIALITGNDPTDATSLVDVIGVIGEDPEATIGQDAWVDADGFWLTKDRTLVRNADVAGGSNALEDVLFQAGGTFTGVGWTSYFKNDFSHLGAHECVCEVNSTTNFNKIPFNMYPNPTNGFLTIEAEARIYGVDILNTVGQKVSSQTYKINSIVSVDVRNITPGIYTMRLTFNDNNVSIQKLIVQ